MGVGGKWGVGSCGRGGGEGGGGGGGISGWRWEKRDFLNFFRMERFEAVEAAAGRGVPVHALVMVCWRGGAVVIRRRSRTVGEAS